MVQEEQEPEQPPQIKEEQEDLLDRPEKAHGILISVSVAPSGANFITTDVKKKYFLVC